MSITRIAFIIATFFTSFFAQVYAANTNSIPCKVNCTVTFDKNPIEICRGEGEWVKFTIHAAITNSEVGVFSTKCELIGGPVHGLLSTVSFIDTLAPDAKSTHENKVSILHDSARGSLTFRVTVKAKCMANDVVSECTIIVPKASGTITINPIAPMCQGERQKVMGRIQNTGSCRESYTLRANIAGDGVVPGNSNPLNLQIEAGQSTGFEFTVVTSPPNPNVVGQFPKMGTVTVNGTIDGGGEVTPAQANVTVNDCGGPDPGDFDPVIEAKDNDKLTLFTGSGAPDLVWVGQEFFLYYTVPVGYSGPQKFSAQYNFSDPQNVTTQMREWGPITIIPSGHMTIQLDSTDQQDDTLRPGKILTASTHEYSGTLYIHGVNPSESPSRITIYLLPDENGKYASSATYDLNVGKLQLEVDADNNNGPEMDSPFPTKYLMPDGSSEEQLFQHFHPNGKIALVNDGDTDEDGIPDFADGFDYAVNGENQSAKNASQCFVPMKVKILGSVPGKYFGSMRIDLNAADPAKSLVAESKRDSEEASLHFDGDLPHDRIIPKFGCYYRAWTKDGNEARTTQDAIKETYWPENKPEISRFGMNANKREGILYIEGLIPGSSLISAGILYQADYQESSNNDTARVTFYSQQIPAVEVQSGGVEPYSPFGFTYGRTFDSALANFARHFSPTVTKDWKLDFSQCGNAVYAFKTSSGSSAMLAPTSVGENQYKFSDGIQIIGGYIPDRPEPESAHGITTVVSLIAPNLVSARKNTRYPITIRIYPIETHQFTPRGSRAPVGNLNDTRRLNVAPYGANSALGSLTSSIAVEKRFFNKDRFDFFQMKDSDNSIRFNRENSGDASVAKYYLPRHLASRRDYWRTTQVNL
jgi:hypothetical protein